MANPAPAANTSFFESMELLLVNSGMRLLAACLILVVGWMLATWIKRWVLAVLAHLPIDLTLKPRSEWNGDLLEKLVEILIPVRKYLREDARLGKNGASNRNSLPLPP